jgi:hypothetical protein
MHEGLQQGTTLLKCGYEIITGKVKQEYVSYVIGADTIFDVHPMLVTLKYSTRYSSKHELIDTINNWRYLDAMRQY